jgi:hypothetical protein
MRKALSIGMLLVILSLVVALMGSVQGAAVASPLRAVTETPTATPMTPSPTPTTPPNEPPPPPDNPTATPLVVLPEAGSPTAASGDAGGAGIALFGLLLLSLGAAGLTIVRRRNA